MIITLRCDIKTEEIAQVPPIEITVLSIFSNKIARTKLSTSFNTI